MFKSVYILQSVITELLTKDKKKKTPKKGLKMNIAGKSMISRFHTRCVKYQSGFLFHIIKSLYFRRNLSRDNDYDFIFSARQVIIANALPCLHANIANPLTCPSLTVNNCMIFLNINIGI